MAGNGFDVHHHGDRYLHTVLEFGSIHRSGTITFELFPLVGWYSAKLLCADATRQAVVHETFHPLVINDGKK